MPRENWNGRRVTKAIAWVVARDHGRCAYCLHPGANSLDHIIPAAERPDLEWDPHNWTAVHMRGAGTNQGCSIASCVCPGNVARGRTPFDKILAFVRAATCTCACTCGARPTTRPDASRQW